jgi:hypothetical protein
MHTFLFCSGIKNEEVPSILDKACRITKKLLPSLGLDLKTAKEFFTMVQGGCFYLSPEIDDKQCLVSKLVKEDIITLVFGNIFRSNGKSAAEKVCDAWQTGKVEAVRRLDGCFSALVVEVKTRKIHILSDVLGFRSLRFFSDGECILISPHDIPIVATGLCPVEIDLPSAGSIVAFDWSLGGKSLLKKISVCNPHDYVTWQAGEIRRTYAPLVGWEGRISSQDQVGIGRHLDRMVENMLENTGSFCRNWPTVCMDLTAGNDTRAVLALVLATVEKSCLRAATLGATHNIEVRTARRLAKMYNFHHEHNLHIPEKIIWDDFVTNCRLRAFMMNGDTNCKRAADQMPSYYSGTPMLTGGSGALYKGYYYKHSDGSRFLKKLSSDVVMNFLMAKFPRIRKLPWQSNELPKRIALRMASVLGALNEISFCGADLLDLFYTYERIGRWGAMAARFTWRPLWFDPFASPKLFQMAFKLPPLILNDLLLHKTIIRRFLPGAYWVPVNKYEFLPLTGRSAAKTLVTKGIKSIGPKYLRLRDLLVTQEYAESHEQARARCFAKLLKDSLSDLLLADDGIGKRIFEQNGLQSIIQDHVLGKRNNLQVIGSLVTLETHRHLLTEAKNMATTLNDYATGAIG